MNKSSYQASAVAPKTQKRPSLFFPARLMSPGEVQTAAAREPAEYTKQVKGRWYLCGEVSDQMYRLIAGKPRQDLALRVSGIMTPAGARYGVVTHQLQGHVHRFLLPLYEPRVGDFLLGMKHGRIGFVLGRSETDDAVLLTGAACCEPEFLPLLALADPLPREIVGRVITELSQVIAEVSRPEWVPTCREGETVVDVSVSVVLPTQTLGGFLAIG